MYTAYHDEEWGVPVHDDRKLFEMLVLEGAQAGLSWLTILKKRAGYREAFEGFDPRTVAGYGESKIRSLLQHPGIVRNRLKIEAAVRNARAVVRIQEDSGSFAAFLWKYVGFCPIQNRWRSLSELPSRSEQSEAMSRDLRKLGCSFVGPTICYAFMQAVGLVNDHVVGCFRHREISRIARHKGVIVPTHGLPHASGAAPGERGQS